MKKKFKKISLPFLEYVSRLEIFSHNYRWTWDSLSSKQSCQVSRTPCMSVQILALIDFQDSQGAMKTSQIVLVCGMFPIASPKVRFIQYPLYSIYEIATYIKLFVSSHFNMRGHCRHAEDNNIKGSLNDSKQLMLVRWIQQNLTDLNFKDYIAFFKTFCRTNI